MLRGRSFPEWLSGMSLGSFPTLNSQYMFICRKRGLVISIGSFSGVSVVSPMLATYAGTKSFLSSFSAALAEEVKDKGIDVECLNTYFVVCTSPTTPLHVYERTTPGFQLIQDSQTKRDDSDAEGLRSICSRQGRIASRHHCS